MCDSEESIRVSHEQAEECVKLAGNPDIHNGAGSNGQIQQHARVKSLNNKEKAAQWMSTQTWSELQMGGPRIESGG